MSTLRIDLRCCIAVVLLSGGVAWGAAAFAQAPDQTTAPSAGLHAQHRAQIVYANGQLEVTADNASLNQILRDVAVRTGMHVSGSVTEQPVYGKYGPAAPATVLANLLDGTGDNMLIKPATEDGPAELVLTPRAGGPSPPEPASTSASAASTKETGAGGASSTETAAGATGGQGAASGANDPANRTPEQIYQRAMQMQAMQRAAAAAQHPQ